MESQGHDRHVSVRVLDLGISDMVLCSDPKDFRGCYEDNMPLRKNVLLAAADKTDLVMDLNHTVLDLIQCRYLIVLRHRSRALQRQTEDVW